jgi:signal transduction histidine kinase
MSGIQLLILENNPYEIELIEQELKRNNIDFEAHHANTKESFVQALAQFSLDCILLDYTLPQFDGLVALKIVRQKDPDIPVIFISGSIGEQRAVSIIKAGATDYVLKTNLKELAPCLKRALSERQQITQEKILKANLKVEHDKFLAAEKLALQEAQSATIAKDELLAVVSHELRTPMAVILGWLQLIKHGDLDKAGVASALNVVERNMQSQARIIEDLLDLSKIVTKKFTLKTEMVEICQLTRDVLQSVCPISQAKSISVGLDCQEQSIVVKGDAKRLRQIFLNLINNAIKFNNTGGRIKIQLQTDSHFFHFSIEDSGEGVDPSFLPNLFHVFKQQEPSMTRRHGGLGIGLVISKHLVELHGGIISASSPGLGLGSTFTVSLPIAPKQKGPVRITKAPAQTNSFLRQTLEGYCILFVEDDVDTLQVIKRLLEYTGAEIITASSAKSGLELFLQRKPNIIILDLMMPGEDGYSLIRKIRALPPEQGGDIPAIAMTAYTTHVNETAAFEAGFQAFLPKPEGTQDLVSTVQNLLRHAQHQERTAGPSAG